MAISPNDSLTPIELARAIFTNDGPRGGWIYENNKYGTPSWAKCLAEESSLLMDHRIVLNRFLKALNLPEAELVKVRSNNIKIRFLVLGMDEDLWNARVSPVMKAFESKLDLLTKIATAALDGILLSEISI